MQANTRRIRKNTQEYAGYAVDTRANMREYAVNTQDTHKDIRRIREDTRRIFTVHRRVFAYGFGYMRHTCTHAHNASGYPLIDPEKFPDMKAMTDHAHSIGLKMG